MPIRSTEEKRLNLFDEIIEVDNYRHYNTFFSVSTVKLVIFIQIERSKSIVGLKQGQIIQTADFNLRQFNVAFCLLEGQGRLLQYEYIPTTATIFAMSMI